MPRRLRRGAGARRGGAGSLRQPELVHRRHGHHAQHADGAGVEPFVRKALHPAGREERHEGGPPGADRGGQPVRRHGPRGPDHPDQEIPFTVIGVLEPKGQSPSGQDQDDTIFIPITTSQKKVFGTPFPGMVRIIYVKARSAEYLPLAEKQVSDLLRQRHRIGPRQENDFTVRNITQVLQASEQSAKMMTLLLGAIASVSLIVGGIGIMNIMLVSVTERTREIGIRMAVGAKTWDIRLQFIIEALT